MSGPIPYSELVQRLAKPGHEIRRAISADQLHLWHMATGVATEAGELLDAVKKNVIYQKSLDRENVVEELGDLEFYMEGLRDMLGITRDEVLRHNIAKLTKRYEQQGKPLGYSDTKAVERADKAREKLQRMTHGEEPSPQLLASHPDLADALPPPAYPQHLEAAAQDLMGDI